MWPSTGSTTCLITALLALQFALAFPHASLRASAGFAPAASASAQAAQRRAPARIDAGQLMADVRALSAPEMEGRLTGSAGSARARQIILERFGALKLEPVGGSYEQTFSFTDNRGKTPRDFPSATNLLGSVPGKGAPEEFILVTAHYDHLGVRDGLVHHGADDNASGVAAMLAIAGCFAQNPGRRSLLFVAFDGEEHGLQGAKYFVRNPPIDLSRVAVVVNLDMLSRGDKNTLYAAGTYHTPMLKEPVAQAAEGRKLTLLFGHDRPGVKGVDDWTQSSDHGPFHGAGIPFLYFGVEDHPDYHKPTDTAEKVPAGFYQEATELVLDTITRLMDMNVPRSTPATRQRAHACAGGAALST